MRFTARDMTRTALLTSLAMAASILVRYGSAVVPFSLLPMVAVLAGCILGKRLGPTSMLLYIFIGLAGIPVFATEPYGGFTYILKPTFGFCLGYMAASWVTGFIVELTGKKDVITLIVASLLGMIAVYLVGLPYLWLALHFFLGKATSVLDVLKIGLFPFIIADIGKAVLSGVVAAGILKRLY